MIIEELININGCLLAVFFTRGSSWQYSILFSDLSFYSPSESYHTKDGAEKMGREAIKTSLER